MGSLYLDWLPDVVAAAIEPLGLSVETFDDDWLRRARSSGGYDAPPLCVMWHHTAGNSNARNSANYGCNSANARPIANMYLDPDLCVICAGGATNTNGSGDRQTFSRGTVGDDKMNIYAVGVEICNNGVGGPYPQRQIDAAFALSAAINARCGSQPTDVCSHQRYAPSRKIDPATATAVQGPWQPRSCNSSGTWNCDDLRNECLRRAGAPSPGPGPTPEPPPEDIVTKDDIDAIAQRAAELVWQHMLDDLVQGKPMAAKELLRYARKDANVASKKP